MLAASTIRPSNRGGGLLGHVVPTLTRPRRCAARSDQTGSRSVRLCVSEGRFVLLETRYGSPPVFRALSAPRRPATPSVSRILRRNARSRVRLTDRALSLKQRASDTPLSLSYSASETILDCAVHHCAPLHVALEHQARGPPEVDMSGATDDAPMLLAAVLIGL